MAYIAAARNGLLDAALVFDRFHVMPMFGKEIRDCRRVEFKESKKLKGLTGQEAIRGSLYLLFSNCRTLKESD